VPAVLILTAGCSDNHRLSILRSHFHYKSAYLQELLETFILHFFNTGYSDAVAEL
jgi:hypothetical protein